MLVTVLGAGLASSFTRTATLSELSGTIACSPVPCIVPLGGGQRAAVQDFPGEGSKQMERRATFALSLFFNRRHGD